MMDYEKYMRRCLELAKIGEYYVAPNPMVGAVLVANNETIIAEGWHKQFGGPHAEVNCFEDATIRHPEITNYKNCTLFVSLEPCSHFGKTPPCADLIIKKGVGQVVIGCLDPNPKVSGCGVKKLQDAGIEVISGILENECRKINKRFLCLHEKHRPYIILKWAQTQDGFVDDDGNKTLVISNPITKQIVHKMRAENMAIMVGTGTVLKDNPKLLTTRWKGRNPIRITLDRHNRIPADAKILNSDAETIVYRENTDWEYILSDLAARNIHSVLVEGGPTLLNTILSSGIYDEIHVEVAPTIANSGVKAPNIKLPTEAYQTILGHKLYQITNDRDVIYIK